MSLHSVKYLWQTHRWGTWRLKSLEQERKEISPAGSRGCLAKLWCGLDNAPLKPPEAEIMNNFWSAKQCSFPSLQVSLIQPTRSDVPLAQSLDKKTSSEMFLTYYWLSAFHPNHQQKLSCKQTRRPQWLTPLLPQDYGGIFLGSRWVGQIRVASW
jgi:hypothetical protein